MVSMDTISPLESAIRHVGLAPMAKALGLTYQALRRWERQGRLPRTEWTGETTYAQQIERLSDGRVTRDELLNWGKPRPELVTEDHPAPESREEAA